MATNLIPSSGCPEPVEGLSFSLQPNEEKAGPFGVAQDRLRQAQASRVGIEAERSKHLEAAQRGLALVWIDFESALAQVPIVARLLAGRLRIEDYRRLLLNLRPQVVEGSRWISRAASNLGPDHEDLRSLFVHHATAEHRDYRLLEKNYVAAGGELAEIRSAKKNIGSEALSAFMYQAASRADPLGMLGAMYVIEGLGGRFAGPWATAIRDQLGLPDDAVSFLSYHGANDGGHLDMFDTALALAVSDRAVADHIVRHAKIVARLYRLQLEELDNV